MINQNLPKVIEEIFEFEEPNAVFTTLLPALGEVLHCDRCFLYFRCPSTRVGKLAYCWRRLPQYPDLALTEWTKEPESWVLEDPMFAAAVRAEPSLFVEDVEAATPDVLNLAFEQKYFKHQALIHANLCWDNLLWGVLQPCVFNHSRIWTATDRAIIAGVVEKITPLVVTYVKAAKI